MATAAAQKIEEKRKSRRKNLREARRADRRRAFALAAGKWDKARSARRAARRNREEAQRDLADIRALRSEYHKHRVLVRLLRSRRRVVGSSGTLTWIDGHQVVSWIAEILIEARKDGVKFTVTSGIRALAKAQYLWNNAGRLGLRHYVSVAYPCSSNHCGAVFPKGAVDLWPWYAFLVWLRRQHGKGRHHKLQSYHDRVGGSDDVHFSHTGH